MSVLTTMLHRLYAPILRVPPLGTAGLVPSTSWSPAKRVRRTLANDILQAVEVETRASMRQLNAINKKEASAMATDQATSATVQDPKAIVGSAGADTTSLQGLFGQIDVAIDAVTQAQANLAQLKAQAAALVAGIGGKINSI